MFGFSPFASAPFAGFLLANPYWAATNNTQNTDWNTVANAQNPNWISISDAQNPNWTPINTFGTS